MVSGLICAILLNTTLPVDFLLHLLSLVSLLDGFFGKGGVVSIKCSIVICLLIYYFLIIRGFGDN